MPHSSGGGSSSGGSHGGGGFSSGGSHGGGGGSSVRTSKSYFPHSRTFVYYRHNHPCYVYSDANLCLKDTFSERILPAIFLLVFIIAFGYAFLFISFEPKKIEYTDNYEIEIIDNLHVINQNEDLEKQLKKFKDKTGITPAIVTVDEKEWTNRYSYLEKYAYNLYVNRYKDETHWLFVYSAPADHLDNWRWEAMQGNDTDPILTEEKCDTFIKIIQNNLLNKSYSVDQAFAKSFETINKKVMKKEGPEVFACCMLGAVVLGLITAWTYLVFPSIFRGYRKSELKEVTKVDSNGKPKERNCDYCGGLYVYGLHDSCPHCGSRVLADEPIANNKK